MEKFWVEVVSLTLRVGDREEGVCEWGSSVHMTWQVQVAEMEGIGMDCHPWLVAPGKLLHVV